MNKKALVSIGLMLSVISITGCDFTTSETRNMISRETFLKTIEKENPDKFKKVQKVMEQFKSIREGLGYTDANLIMSAGSIKAVAACENKASIVFDAFRNTYSVSCEM